MPGAAVLDDIFICDTMVNHISLRSPTYDVNLVMADSVFYIADGPSKALVGFDYSFDISHFQINYNDGNDNSITFGEFEILKLICNWRRDTSTETIVLLLDQGIISIN